MILGYLPVYIAREFYPFEILNCNNDDQSINAVIEGRADISMSDPFMFNEIDYKNVKVISGFIKKPLLYLITFNPFLKDLNKKILVTYPKPSTTFLFASKLSKENDLDLIETPFNTELGPLLTQEADAGLVIEPNYSQAVLNGAITLDSFDIPFAFTGFCSKKPCKDFLRAVGKGIEIFKNDPVETLRVAKKYFHLDEDILKLAIDRFRSNEIYGLKFSSEEIKNAFALRGMSVKKYGKYL
jgi:ABC-type nitrate/sulfonate/bicarbonate transport system substrate-binding protein